MKRFAIILTVFGIVGLAGAGIVAASEWGHGGPGGYDHVAHHSGRRHSPYPFSGAFGGARDFRHQHSTHDHGYYRDRYSPGARFDSYYRGYRGSFGHNYRGNDHCHGFSVWTPNFGFRIGR